MKLGEMRNNPGARKKRKRIGRGPGSGHGKTSCRGHKGQKSRSGSSLRPGFEGGQMPLIRRLPKRGFRSRKRYHLEAINVARLDIFDEGSRVDMDALVARGVVKKRAAGIKILGKGEIGKKLRVVADAFSASARKMIEDAGGTAEIAEKKRKTKKSVKTGAPGKTAEE